MLSHVGTQRFRLVAFALLAATLIACADQGPRLHEEPRLAGSYSLHSLDGEPLPYELLIGGTVGITIVSGALALREDGTYTRTELSLRGQP